VTNFKILIVPVGYEHYDGDTFDFTPELNIDEYRELFFSEIRINNSGISARFRSKNKHDLASVLKIIQDQVNFRKKGLILLCPLRKFYKIRLEDRSVIYEYLGKYLTNQNDIRIGLIKLLHNQELEYPQNYPGIPFLKENSLEGVKGFYSAEYYERIQSVVRRSGSTEEMEQNIAFQKMVLDVGLFLTDLERLYHMFKKKSVQANYFIILDALKDLIDENESKKLNDLIDSLDDGISLMHRIISAKLGQQPEKAQIIREHIHLMNKYGKDLSEGNLPLILIEISKLLEKFHIRYNKAELNDLVSQAIDEEKLEEFEQNLGSPSEGDNELIPEDFHDMDGYEFEEFLLQVFERLGYSVLNTPLSGDQGADLVMVKDSEKTIVQAKHYSGSVPNKAIQEIVAAKNFYKAKYAMVVTSGNFSKSAFELARVNDVELWDGNQLADTIRKINEGRTRTFPSSINLNYKINGDDVQTFEVKCPVCDMVFEVTMNIRQDNEFECPACGIKMSTQKKSAD
jgi:predicted RNA-binding Zn-ribbon protein involved in translation (DUF1610 family)